MPVLRPINGFISAVVFNIRVSIIIIKFNLEVRMISSEFHSFFY